MCAVATLGDGEQVRIGFVRQQRRIRHRARCEHAHDFALDRAFGGGGIADLLANGDRVSEFEEFGEVLFCGMIRHAGHFDWLTIGRAARGQRNAENARGLHRIVKKQFVKITHAIKQQRIRMVCFNAQILGHHGGVFDCGCAHAL